MPDSLTDGEVRNIFSAHTTEENIQYLQENMKAFIHPQDSVLLCTLAQDPPVIGEEIRQALENLDVEITFWNPDQTWRDLMWLAFSRHVSVVVGSARLILGLAKLARETDTPLNIQHVLVTGSLPGCELYDSIRSELDCTVEQCYTPAGSDLIVGFTEPGTEKVQLREDAFSVSLGEFRDETGREVLITRENHVWHTGDLGQTEENSLTYLRKDCTDPENPQYLDSVLLPWSSILDYEVQLTEYGQKLELVVFSGEALPELPTFAGMVVRGWAPHSDRPFPILRKPPVIS